MEIRTKSSLNHFVPETHPRPMPQQVSRFACWAGAGLATLLMVAAPARASTILPVGFEEMSRRAGTIVKAKVIASESFEARGDASVVTNYVERVASPLAEAPQAAGDDRSGASGKSTRPVSAPIGRPGGAVMTRTRLRILDSLKGNAAGTMELVTAGGTVNGVTVEIAGMPKLALDQTYLLFVRPDYATTGVPIVGVYQGAFRYATDRKTGAAILLNGEGMPVLGIQDGQVRVQAADDPSRTHSAPAAVAAPIAELGASESTAAAATEAPPAAPMSPEAFADAVRAAVANAP